MDIRHSSFFFKNFKMTAVIIPEFMVSHQSLNFGKKVKVKLSRRSLQPPNKSGIKGCHTSLGELVITALGSWEQPGWLLGSPVAPLRPPMKAQPVPSKPPFNQKQSAALLVIHGNLQWSITHALITAGLVSVHRMSCVPFYPLKELFCGSHFHYSATCPRKCISASAPAPCSMCQGSYVPGRKTKGCK